MNERKLIQMFLEVEAGRPAIELMRILAIDEDKIEEVRNAPKGVLTAEDKHFSEWVETQFHKQEMYSESDMDFNITENIFIIMRPPFESDN
ncbi:hypothetical protein SAMN05444266_10474 [Chitinophaga jiangningensis]|uniref:Uncharacterized protein n=2 Tax=Chitinophaga jiangningensis TaxID=1419482 RepID=A0A1M7BUJ1_9BACT|nr:hypothetical protein SAMN05444266_10474 [Chitinophaga jiangningensis]